MADETKTCPFCGEEIKASAIKCRYCGEVLIENHPEPNNERVIKIALIVGFCLILFLVLAIIKIPKLNINNTNQAIKMSSDNNIKNKQNLSPSETLELIDTYQEKYFNLIERNDFFIKKNNSLIENQNKRELDALFKEVRNTLNKNNPYLEKLNSIDSHYENVSYLDSNNFPWSIIIKKQENKSGLTSAKLNSIYYNEQVDKLLNEVYQKIRTSIPKGDFEQLKQSEIKWLKDIDQYHKHCIEKTQSCEMKDWYLCNMRRYRILLLLQYLNGSSVETNSDKNTINVNKKSDYIGSWLEVVSGRVYIEIEDMGNYIKVIHGGSNSAFSHSESTYNCHYDDKTGNLICKGAKHVDNFASCDGFSSNDNLDKYLECEAETPELIKEDSRTYIDNKERILSIKKGNKNHSVIDENSSFGEAYRADVHKNYQDMGLYFKNESESYYYFKEK